MPVSIPFTGGCACGAIRYECSADPMMSLNCHCRDCQRATGSAYNTVVGVPAARVQFTQGVPNIMRRLGSEGHCSIAVPARNSLSYWPRGKWTTIPRPVKASSFRYQVCSVDTEQYDPKGF